MPKPMRNGGCCACAGATHASETTISPLDSHRVSLFIPISSSQRGGDAYTALSALSINRRRRRGDLGAEPVQDLCAGPMQDARLAEHVPIEPLEVADAVRDS